MNFEVEIGWVLGGDDKKRLGEVAPQAVYRHLALAHDFQGTYPLPEAQLDRFAVRITLGYPEMTHEMEILYGQNQAHPFDDLQPVISGADILHLQALVRDVTVDKALAEYILRLVDWTRNDPRIRLAVSPRGSLTLFRTAQARALIEGRSYVLPGDIHALAVPVLAHRMMLDIQTRYGGLTGVQMIEEALTQIPVPR